ncbi:MAG: VOC family protein, partial [Ktedonobacterales bacterium]|nr:VOC family protein [Ktedonobacterales bacterium]
MLTQIDHVVIVVRDLAAAMRDYAALGFTVTPGGAHAGGQTHNALVAFADGTYLELIAFIQPDQPSPHYWYPRLAEGEGIEDFCVLADDLAADAARWAAQGLAVVGPDAGGRQRPDGTELRWQTVRFTQAAGAALLPFAIADDTPRVL